MKKPINFTHKPQLSWPGTKRLTDWYRSVTRGLGTAAVSDLIPARFPFAWAFLQVCI